MKFCKTNLIPCPFVLTEWSELPCSATKEQCDEWCGRVKDVPIQKEDGSILPMTEELLGQMAKEAKTLFDHGLEVTLKVVLSQLNK